ncbi:hypothetical protein NDU88_000778 [Pleurodeles waltl]|uniref:Uncharacterized protein n=1 Tax=Pleurodeles waltl TaxID=8319 RepID=A0AAV7KUD1_PLEWA|nr:hypothetical protein NDU88_000778 [Pleurodeles waltl]
MDRLKEFVISHRYTHRPQAQNSISDILFLLSFTHYRFCGSAARFQIALEMLRGVCFLTSNKKMLITIKARPVPILRGSQFRGSRRLCSVKGSEPREWFLGAGGTAELPWHRMAQRAGHLETGRRTRARKQMAPERVTFRGDNERTGRL